MKLKSKQPKATAEQVVKDIRRATRRHYSTEGKIRIESPRPSSVAVCWSPRICISALRTLTKVFAN